MSTMTTYLSSEEVSVILREAGMIKSRQALKDLYNTRDYDSMADAQHVLADNGYMLEDARMVEGEWYELDYRSSDGNVLTLRYEPHFGVGPWLKACYREDG